MDALFESIQSVALNADETRALLIQAKSQHSDDGGLPLDA